MDTYFDNIINKSDVKMYSEMPSEDFDYILHIINTARWGDIENQEGFSYLGSGEFGYVYGYKNYAIKIFNDMESPYNEDEKNLAILHHLPSYPTLYAGHKGFIIEELIKGRVFAGCEDEDLIIANKNCIDILLDDIKETLKLGVELSDTHEENLMITDDGFIKIIDVGFFDFVNKNLLNSYLEKKANNITLKEHLLNLISFSARMYIEKIDSFAIEEQKIA